jgi:hypothetical protein
MDRTRSVFALLAAVVLVAASCGDRDRGPDTGAAGTVAPGDTAPGGTVHVPSVITGTTGAPGPGTAGTPGTPAAPDPDTIGAAGQDTIRP